MYDLTKIQHNSLRLNEIIIIRLLLVICLVLYHSFAPYCGSWRPLVNNPIDSYYWIAKIAYSFFLGSYVFISGYLYAYGTKKKGRQSLKNIIWNKFRRLIIPSILFSILYVVIFRGYECISIWRLFYDIVNGKGHMWFLPMLFWLFIGGYILSRLRINTIVILIITLLLVGLSALPLPFRLNSAFKYLIFFYLGYCMYPFRKNIVAIMNSHKFLFWVGFICIFISYISLFVIAESYWDYYFFSSFIGKIVLILMRIFYTIAGTLAVYLASIWFIEYRHIKISNTMVTLSSYCFGIYIFQQFILRYLYYYTSYPLFFYEKLVPWLAFLFTLVLSVILTYIALRFRIGRALIG